MHRRGAGFPSAGGSAGDQPRSPGSEASRLHPPRPPRSSAPSRCPVDPAREHAGLAPLGCRVPAVAGHSCVFRLLLPGAGHRPSCKREASLPPEARGAVRLQETLEGGTRAHPHPPPAGRPAARPPRALPFQCFPHLSASRGLWARPLPLCPSRLHRRTTRGR